MKITKYPIMLLAGVAAMFASCDDKEATQPTAAISVDKYHYEVNESMQLRFIGNADNVVVYPGDENHDYELRTEANSGLVVNKGLLTYAYPKPGVYHVVCVATNHEDAGNSILSDTTSVWVTVTDDVNTIKDVTVSVLNINEVYAELMNETDWRIALPRKVRYNKKDVNLSLRNQRLAIYQDSPSATVKLKEAGASDDEYKQNTYTTKYDLAKVFDIRSTAGSGGVRDYRLYTLYYGEFKSFKLAGVTGKVERNEYDYSTYVIDMEVPAGTDLTAVAPEFTLNDPATEKVFIGDEEQVSGTPVDFTSPVTYRFVTSHADNPAITVEAICKVTVTVK